MSTELHNSLCRSLSRPVRCAACACNASSFLGTTLNIVVCGSGPGAQTAAALLGAQGHRVYLYYSATSRYSDRGETLRNAIEANNGCITLETQGQVCCNGPIRGVSSNASTLFSNADLIIISLNGPAMEPLIVEMAPYLRSNQVLLYLPSMGAANYLQLKFAMRDAAIRKNPENAGGKELLRLPTYASTRTLPWACRVIAPGIVNLCGTKGSVDLALAPGDTKEEADAMSTLLSSLFLGTAFPLNPNPSEASFLPFGMFGNPTLHPGVMYGTWVAWDGVPLKEKPKFYHGVTPETIEVVDHLQDETKATIAAYSRFLGLESPPEMSDLHAILKEYYDERIADQSTLYTCLRTNSAYADIYHPMKQLESGGWVPDFGNRLLSEDLPCGLVAIRGVATILGVPTPWIDRVIMWGQEKLGKEYLTKDGELEGRDIGTTLCPQRFGIHEADHLLITNEGVGVAPAHKREDEAHDERPAASLLRTVRTLPRHSQ